MHVRRRVRCACVPEQRAMAAVRSLMYLSRMACCPRDAPHLLVTTPRAPPAISYLHDHGDRSILRSYSYMYCRRSHVHHDVPCSGLALWTDSTYCGAPYAGCGVVALGCVVAGSPFIILGTPHVYLYGVGPGETRCGVCGLARHLLVAHIAAGPRSQELRCICGNCACVVSAVIARVVSCSDFRLACPMCMSLTRVFRTEPNVPSNYYTGTAICVPSQHVVAGAALLVLPELPSSHAPHGAIVCT